MATITDINGIGPALAKRLAAMGITTVDQVAAAKPATLAEVQGLSVATATNVIGAAQEMVGSSGPLADAGPGVTSTSQKFAEPVKPVAEAAKKTVAAASSKGKPEIAKLKKKVSQLESQISKLEKQLRQAIKEKAKKAGKSASSKKSKPKGKKKGKKK